MMTRPAKTAQLRRHIAAQLDGLIDRDYALLGLPYYLNVGDILIWEGEREYLGSKRFACVNAGHRYRDLETIRQDTLILLQGGGNFGDLWRFIQEDRLSIIRRYGSNPIVILPVTCWYEDAALLESDAEALAQHPELTICARDSISFDILRKHFRNRILLVPDMAFCINPAKLNRYVQGGGEGTLFLKRTDKELAAAAPYSPIEILNAADVRDWPSMESTPPCWNRYRSLCQIADSVRDHSQYRGASKLSRILLKLSDWYYHNRCRVHLIREGVHFLSRYRNIYTTRLHGGILAILLDMPVTILDNSYGKNASYFYTWLSETEEVTIIGTP